MMENKCAIVSLVIAVTFLAQGEAAARRHHHRYHGHYRGVPAETAPSTAPSTEAECDQIRAAIWALDAKNLTQALASATQHQRDVIAWCQGGATPWSR